MITDDEKSSQSNLSKGPEVWPVVAPEDVRVAEYESDLAYMGFYLKLKIANRSPYLVREAVLRIDGFVGGFHQVNASQEVKVGPLFPEIYVHEEVGIGARGGITGLRFNSVSADAVRLTPPSQMVPAPEYPQLEAEILKLNVEKEEAESWENSNEYSDEIPTVIGTSICFRVRNSGPAVVERVRLKLRYFENADELKIPPRAVAEWIFDMPRRGWNPYRIPGQLDVFGDPVDQLLPNHAYEFTIKHYNPGPVDWARRRDALSIEVLELKFCQ
ncbi:hypothetical protein JW935_12025 [candidate division KSB1 bacterium]|nr:hypothetical protein [candidate division KSB1 bacterium]